MTVPLNELLDEILENAGLTYDFMSVNPDGTYTISRIRQEEPDPEWDDYANGHP